jgi:hypothetical protein
MRTTFYHNRNADRGRPSRLRQSGTGHAFVIYVSSVNPRALRRLLKVEGCSSVGNFIRVPRRRSRTWEPESGQTPGTLVRLVRYRKVAVALWTDLDLPIFALSSVQWGSIEWALDGRLTELSDLTLIECRTSRSCRSRANHWFNNGASRPARSPCSELVLLLAKFSDPFRFFPVADLRQSVEFGVGVFSSGKLKGPSDIFGVSGPVRSLQNFLFVRMVTTHKPARHDSSAIEPLHEIADHPQAEDPLYVGGSSNRCRYARDRARMTSNFCGGCAHIRQELTLPMFNAYALRHPEHFSRSDPFRRPFRPPGCPCRKLNLAGN